MHKCLKNSIVFKDVIFYLRWYNVIRWSSHICKKSSFLSFFSFLVKFSEWHKGSGRVKLTKCDKVEWGENLWKWHTFCMAHLWFVILLPYYLYWENVTSYEKFSHNLTFEVQILLKIPAFQYLMKVSKYWKIAEFPKIYIEMKNRKTFYKAKQQAA